MKNIHTRNFSGQYFPAFGLNTERREIAPCLKLVRINLETWNLVRKYTHICSFRKYTFYYQDPLNFADVSISFVKSQHILAKIVLLLKAIV